MQPVIQVHNLKRSFKQYKKEPGVMGSLKSLVSRKYFEIDAVKGINLEINQGERVGFIGPNGAGKTTTLKMLSGILYPTSGDVNVLGYKPYERKAEFQKQFALVMGQKSQLWWDLPAIETLTLNKEIYQIDDKIYNDLLSELTTLLELKDLLNIPVRKLSLGQRMKCELLASLIHNPKLLFLDEPTIGLDIVVQKRVRQFLKDYNAKFNTTLILTSHYMDDVAELCERIIIIDKGQIIFDGSLQSLNDKYINKKYLKLVFNKSVNEKDVDKYGEIVEFDHNGLSATISIDKGKHLEAASSILKQLPVDDMDISEADLEDIISKVFEGK